MSKKRVRISVLVTPQTAFHLKQMSHGFTGNDMGRAVDKLVRDRMVLLREALQVGRKNPRERMES